MAKEIVGYLKLQVKGGEAKPAPPVGPMLGSKGLDIMGFCKRFNAETQDRLGKLLPVRITIYADKSFDFVIKTPPVTSLIMEKLDIAKGSSEPNRNKVGELDWDSVKEIALAKMEDLNTLNLESAMETVAATARSMGVTIKK